MLISLALLLHSAYLLASSLADLYNSRAVLKYKISTVGPGFPNGRAGGGSEHGRLFHRY